MQTWLWIYWLWALSLTISRKKEEEKKVSGWSRYFFKETNKQNDVNFWLIIVPYRKRNKHLHRFMKYSHIGNWLWVDFEPNQWLLNTQFKLQMGSKCCLFMVKFKLIIFHFFLRKRALASSKAPLVKMGKSDSVTLLLG